MTGILAAILHFAGALKSVPPGAALPFDLTALAAIGLLAALPLLARGASVTEVALDLGYESAPAFTTMFRRMLGVAPRTYLRQGGRGRPFPPAGGQPI